MMVVESTKRPGRIALLGLLLFLLSATSDPLEAQVRRGTAGYARRNTSAEIIARRKAEAESRANKRRAGVSGAAGAGGTDVAAVQADLRQMADAAGWQDRLSDSRIRRLAPMIVAEAGRYRLPPALVMAIIHLESQYVPGARSRAGATGLMQVMPAWRSTLGTRFGTDLTDEATNLRYGTWVLQNALAQSGGDLRRALLRYNGCRPERDRTGCSSYPDRVRQRVEAHARRSCQSRDWQSCVVEPLRHVYTGGR